MMTFDEIRSFCYALDNVSEEPHFERTSFRVKKKIFLTHKEGTDELTVKLSPRDQDLFSLPLKGAVYPIPNKWGQQGWTIVEFSRLPEKFLKEIIETSYKTVSKK